MTTAYNIKNRLVSATHSLNGTDNYVYDPSNRRVWKQEAGQGEKVCFYGVDGTLMQAGTGSGAYDSFSSNINVYFAGKQVWRAYSNGMYAGAVVQDRLGSAGRYFPYGEEYTTTQEDRTKFATYYRDTTTALDYANQRYYGRTFGRFLTVDPYGGSAGPSDPQSWNRYRYANGDPVNFLDPTGLNPCSADEGFCIDPEITFKYLELGLSPYDITGRPAEQRKMPSPDPVPADITHLTDAVGVATKVLGQKPCSDLFNGADPVSILTSLAAPGGSQYGRITFGFLIEEAQEPPSTAEVRATQPNPAAATGYSVNVVINALSDAEWYGGYVDTYGGHSQDELRAATLIHELGHVFANYFGPTSTAIQNDSRDVRTSWANRNKVMEACFGWPPPSQRIPLQRGGRSF